MRFSYSSDYTRSNAGIGTIMTRTKANEDNIVFG